MEVVKPWGLCAYDAFCGVFVYACVRVLEMLRGGCM
jgi:hypothetical protein